MSCLAEWTTKPNFSIATRRTLLILVAILLNKQHKTLGSLNNSLLLQQTRQTTITTYLDRSNRKRRLQTKRLIRCSTWWICHSNLLISHIKELKKSSVYLTLAGLSWKVCWLGLQMKVGKPWMKISAALVWLLRKSSRLTISISKNAQLLYSRLSQRVVQMQRGAFTSHNSATILACTRPRLKSMEFQWSTFLSTQLKGCMMPTMHSMDAMKESRLVI